jgi:hypothetical protein
MVGGGEGRRVLGGSEGRELPGRAENDYKPFGREPRRGVSRR